jgi:RNA polymerase sigma-70 factor (ECF subfamily)
MQNASELERLMRHSLDGDAESYRALLKSCAALLRPYVAKRLFRASASEDVVQEILLSLHKARHTYDGARPFLPWLYAIANFRISDYLRGHYTDRLSSAVELEPHHASTEDVTEYRLAYEDIRKSVSALSGKAPEILRLLHEEGCTAKEVGMRMGMSETAVKVAAHRAYKTLRKQLAS